jgi:hypothetical protein
MELVMGGGLGGREIKIDRWIYGWKYYRLEIESSGGLKIRIGDEETVLSCGNTSRITDCNS